MLTNRCSMQSRSGRHFLCAFAALIGLWACGNEGRGASDDVAPAPALIELAPPEQQLAFGPQAPPADAAKLLAQRERGLLHHGLAQPEATLEHLIPVYRADPTDDSVALAVAEASLWKKDAATAHLVLGQLQTPDAPQALRVRALMLEQTLRFAEALELYDRAIPQLDPPWGTLERKAQVLSWQKRFDESRATYARVAEARQASGELRQRCRLRMAEITAWKKDFGGALAELHALLEEAPELVEALLLSGQILEWQGEFSRAKQTYASVLRVDSQHSEARSRLDRLLWVD